MAPVVAELPAVVQVSISISQQQIEQKGTSQSEKEVPGFVPHLNMQHKGKQGYLQYGQYSSYPKSDGKSVYKSAVNGC